MTVNDKYENNFVQKSLILLLADTMLQDFIFHLVMFFVFGSAKHGMSHPWGYENNLVVESDVAVVLLKWVSACKPNTYHV